MASGSASSSSTDFQPPGPNADTEEMSKSVSKRFEVPENQSLPSTSSSSSSSPSSSKLPVKWLKAARKLTFDEEPIPSKKKNSSKEKFVDPKDQPSTSK